MESAINGISKVIMTSIIFIMIGSMIYSFISNISDRIEKKRKLRSYKKIKKEDYYRELPCKGDLFLTYYIASKYKTCDYLSLKGNLATSFFLKWVKKGLVKIQGYDPGTNDVILYIDTSCENAIDDNIERHLYEGFKESVGTNKTFKEDDILHHIRNKNVINFLSEAYQEGERRLIKYAPKPDESKQYFKEYRILNFIKELKKEINGFKYFIVDFTSLDKKDLTEFPLWDNYVIFANLLGLIEHFKKGTFIKNEEFMNPEIKKIINSGIFDKFNEYSHKNIIYSEEEYASNKRAISKSQNEYLKNNSK